MAGVARDEVDLHFAWHAWNLATWAFTLHSRRGTWRPGPSLCAAGVARVDMDLHYAWHACHVALVARLVGYDAVGLCVALGVMELQLAWQAWLPLVRTWSTVARLYDAWQAWHLETWSFTLRGKCGRDGGGRRGRRATYGTEGVAGFNWSLFWHGYDI